MAKNTTTLNKFLTGSVTAAMVATAIVPVASANTNTADGFTYSDVAANNDHYENIMKARTYELMTGNTDGTFEPAKLLTRSNVVKALGKYVIAQSGGAIEDYDVSDVEPFADTPSTIADKELYNYSLIVKKAGIFSGSNNNLEAAKLINRQQMAKVLVNAFGLKDLAGKESSVTDNDKAFAEFVPYINILSENEVTAVTEFMPLTNTSRAQFASFLVRAFEIANPVEEVAPEVVSVSATNLKTIEVALNTAVDEKTVTATNVTLKDGTTPVGVTVSLSEDGKTVYVTASGSSKFVQGKEYNLVADGLKTAEGVALPLYAAVVKTLDTTVPVVEAALLTSPKTVELYFSENVNFPTTPQVLTNILQIDGINAYAQNIDASKLATEGKVVVTLGTALTVGDHKVKVANLQDDAGFPIASKEFTATLVADVTAPSVTSVVASAADKIEVTFSEVVDTTSFGTSTFLVKVPGQADRTATISGLVEGNTYEFNLSAPLDLSATVDATLSYKGVKDNYGNTVADASTFAFKAGDDTLAPTVTNVKVNTDNSLEVSFSESVLGFATGDVELYDKDNKKMANAVTVAPKVINGSASTKVYTLTITGGTGLKGVHSIKILKDQVTDNSIRKNKLAEVTLPVTLNDKVAPNVVKAEYVNDVASTVDFNTDNDYLDSKVTIYFDEAMDAASLTNKANFLIGNQPLADVVGNVTLTPSADNKAVTITINRSSADGVGQLTFATGQGSNVRLIAVKDAAGITLDSSDVNTPLNLTSFVAAPAFSDVVASVQAVAKNQVKVTAVTGYLFNAIDANKILFSENNSATDLIPGLQVIAVSIAADGKTATLTLNNNLSADRKFDGTDAGTVESNVSLYAAADAFLLTNGSKSLGTAANAGIVVTDKISSSVVLPTDGKLDVTGNVVDITFDEAIDVIAGLNDGGAAERTALAQAFTVKNSDGDTLTPGVDYTVAALAGNTNTIKLTVAGAAYSDALTVALNNNTVIVDGNQNVANSFATVSTDKEVGLGLGFASSQTTAGVAGTPATAASGTVTYGTPVDGETVTVDGTVFTKAAVAGAAAFTNISELTALIDGLADVTATSDGTVITVTAAATGTAGNSITLAENIATGGSVSGATLANGSASTPGTAEVNKLTFTTGASSAGSFSLTFADGSVTDVTTVTVVGDTTDDTAAEVAAKVAAAINVDGIAGYTVTASGADVLFTANSAAADKTVSITLN